ncbi:MAG TPA: galactokinase [Bryobacteraceae bacterium]|jgi:galactokinase
MNRAEAIACFNAHFGPAKDCRVFRAPGRVNLIGEHTDYNLGFVLPTALEMACYVAGAEADGGRITVFSEERNEERSWNVADLDGLKPANHWSDYFAGVAQGLVRTGVELAAGRYLVHSEVPEGSGLSSSAAFEVASAMALLGGRPMDRLKLARLCQRAEIEFVGNPCGIMDQYISVFGKAHKAIKLDCRSLTHETVSIPDGVEIYAVNSMVKHELSGSAYRDRVAECRSAAEVLARVFPEVKTLRDATPAQLGHVQMPAVIARRARHVVSEDIRVELWMHAASRGDLERMGELFVESHRSLQHDYEVSAEELDFLVDAAIGIEGVYGARMTGGGFGGCTVNLVRPDAAESFQREIRSAYQERFGIVPAIYRCVPSKGADAI